MSHLAKRAPVLGAGALALAAAVLAAALLASSSSARSSRRLTASAASASTTIRVRHTRIGTILVNQRGLTLYAFTRDRRNHDACAAVRGCLSVWPITALHGTLRAGRGVNRSRLGTIRVGSARQVTYAGHPLYGYIGNAGPGDISYVGARAFGGRWLAITPRARLVG